MASNDGGVMFFWIINMVLFVIYTFVFSRRENKCVYLFFSLTHLMIVSAIRNVNVGTDTFYYAKAYSYLSKHSQIHNHAMSNSEVFVYFLKFFAKIFPNINGYVVVTSISFFVLIGLFIYNYSQNYYISIYLFVFMYFYFNSLNTARQYLAMSVLMVFFYLMDNKKYIIAFLCGLIAIGIHSATLPGVIICVAVSLIWWTPQLTLLATIGIHLLSYAVPAMVNIFVRFMPQYIWMKRYIFTANYSSRGRASLLFALYGELTIFLGLYWLYWKDKKIRLIAFGDEIRCGNETSDHAMQIMQRMIVIVSIATMMYVFYSKVIIFNRMANILFVFIIVLLSNVLDNFEGRHRFIIILLLLPLVLFTCYQLKQGIAGVVDYRSFLFG